MKRGREALDLLAANPWNPEAVEPKIRDLAALTVQMERQAAARISKVMAALPDEKRQEFLSFSEGPCGCRAGNGVWPRYGPRPRTREEWARGSVPALTTQNPERIERIFRGIQR